MSRLSLEIVQLVVLSGLALALHTAIRRTGINYAAEVFVQNPGIGKAFLVLADVGFYLIFAAYSLFNVQLENGDRVATYAQLQEVIYSVAGIALIIGVLHLVNVVALPVMARLLGGGRMRNDEQTDALRGRLGELMVTVTLNDATSA